ncbi:ATP-binding protein [Rhodovibrionaceae bacterium A322]
MTTEQGQDRGQRSLRERLFRPDGNSEHEQALVRIAAGLIVISYCLVLQMLGYDGWANDGFHGGNLQACIYVAFVGMAYATGLLISIVHRPAPSVPRQFLGMLHDNVSLTFFLLFGGELTAFWFPVYLWNSFGHGFRYGPKLLVASAVVSVVGFFWVVMTTPYWYDQGFLSAGLLTGLVVLPAYAFSLLRKLTRAKAQAEIANQAKSAFLANMSHELRTPLNAIIVLSRLLRSGQLTADQRDMVHSIHLSGRSLLSLIGNVLDLSKAESGRLELSTQKFDLYEVLAEVQAIAQPQCQEKGLGFSLFLASDVPWQLEGDPQFLKQILINLTGNAAKFTSEGQVELQVYRPTSREAKAVQKGFTQLRFEVVDSGIGISEEAQARVFERFVQADEGITKSFGGTGLGLAISRQLAQLMEGVLGVVSQPGAGSTFWLEAPFRHVAATGQQSNEEGLSPAADDPSDKALVDVLPSAGRRALVFGRSDLAQATQQRLQDLQYINGRCEKLADAAEQLNGAGGQGLPLLFLVADSIPDEVYSWLASFREKGITLPAVYVGPPQSDERRLKRHFLSWVEDPEQTDDLVRAAHLLDRLLPPVELEPEEGEAGDAASQAGRSLSILVADDNEVNRRVAERTLVGVGHRVALVTNGEEALDALDEAEDAGEPFDLVLLDMHMPVMSGIETAKFYRMTHLEEPGLPLIALTADVTQDTREQVAEAGMDACLNKPLDIDLLMETLRDVMAKRGVDLDVAPRPKAETDNVVTHPRFSNEVHPVIDHRVIQRLEDLGDGDDFVFSLIDDFVADTLGLQQELKEALEDLEAMRFRDLLHAMRGSAINIGASNLYELLLANRSIGTDGLESQGKELVQQIEEELLRAHHELQRYQAEHQSQVRPGLG